MTVPFVSEKTFLTPELTNDGKPYGPVEMERLIHAKYYITRFTNTSYTDAGQITPMEREYILGYIKEEKEQEEKAIDKVKNKGVDE